MSWWKAEGNGADALGRNPGTLNEGVSFVPGRSGQAFDFHGAGFVEVPSSPTLQTPTVTVMAWVRHLGTPGLDNYVLSQGAVNCQAASYGMYSGLGDRQLKFGIFNNTQSFTESPDAGPEVWDGNWHFVAGTYDGAPVRMYKDGVEMGSGTPATLAINYALPTNQHFYIGAYSGTCQLRFNGDIDDVRVFNRALSATEIQSIFSGTL